MGEVYIVCLLMAFEIFIKYFIYLIFFKYLV